MRNLWFYGVVMRFLSVVYLSMDGLCAERLDMERFDTTHENTSFSLDNTSFKSTNIETHSLHTSYPGTGCENKLLPRKLTIYPKELHCKGKGRLESRSN